MRYIKAITVLLIFLTYPAYSVRFINNTAYAFNIRGYIAQKLDTITIFSHKAVQYSILPNSTCDIDVDCGFVISCFCVALKMAKKYQAGSLCSTDTVILAIEDKK